MPLRYLFDENLRGLLWQAILRHNLVGGLIIDAVRVGDVADLPLGSPDAVILAWCEREGRILVSLDYDTMAQHVATHLTSGAHVPGVLLIRPGQSLKAIVEVLELIAHAGLPGDYRDQVVFVP
jgi:hypothetical protein